MIHIITLFPAFFQSFFKCGVVGRAIGDRFDINLVQMRDYAHDTSKSVDDTPYGGGQGMVIRADVLKRALEEGILESHQKKREQLHIVLPDPRGKTLNGQMARAFGERHLQENAPKDVVFICGRYEGIDERFTLRYVDEQISVGDFVLSGGELAAMAILESSMRFVPNVLGNHLSADNDSFENGLLGTPAYTRPSLFEGLKVPEVFLSGHHKKIEQFRKEEKIRITKAQRPDLMAKQ